MYFEIYTNNSCFLRLVLIMSVILHGLVSCTVGHIRGKGKAHVDDAQYHAF